MSAAPGWIALLALLWLAPGALAHADDAAQARFFDERARASFARGEYRAALHDFLAAHDAAQNPRTLYNVALCAELAGSRGLAFAWFQEYLEADDDDAARLADARRRMDALRGTLALVRVTSEPAGALIYVDRRQRGEWGRAPRTLVLPPGPHRVELELEGHHPASVEIEAVAGEEREVAVALRPRTGTLRVLANVEGARVEIAAGAEVLLVEDAGRSLELPVGRYVVRVRAEGYEDAGAEVVVGDGATEERAFVLRSRPVPSGRLLVSTGGVRARLAIDGEPRAETPAVIESLPAGRHQVELRARGHVPWRGEVLIEAGRARYLSVTLVPAH